MKRDIYIIESLIDKFKLDLRGLSIITELASGPYIYTPVIALMAGASVVAVGKDSEYGSFSDNKKKLDNLISSLDINTDIKCFKDEIPLKYWRNADIITNSGFVRPISEDRIKLLKETAVIPLMWETWEFREDDLDIKACQKNNICVIGTNESYKGINMFGYNVFMALKLLFELNIEIHNNKLVLLGGGKTGEAIAEKFFKLELNFLWFKNEKDSKYANSYSYDELDMVLRTKHIDAIVCAEHSDYRCLVGKNGFITFKQLYSKHPSIKWGHICGNIDIDELKKSKIGYFPRKLNPVYYMSYQAFDLGNRPVLELNAAGLKVGEVAAKARVNRFSVNEAINKTIEYGIGQDFEGGFFKFRL